MRSVHGRDDVGLELLAAAGCDRIVDNVAIGPRRTASVGVIVAPMLVRPWVVISVAMVIGCGTAPVAPTAPVVPDVEARLIWLDGTTRAGTGTLRVAGGAVTAQYKLDDQAAEHRIDVALDAGGVPVRYQARDAGRQAESFQRAPGDASFHVPLTDDPFTTTLLTRALLATPTHRLALSPAGEARLEVLAVQRVRGAAGERQVTAYAIDGLRLVPVVVWLDAERRLVAALDAGGFGPIDPDLEAAIPALRAAEDAALDARAERAAAGLGRRRGPSLVIRNARLFDPVTMSTTPGRSVRITGDAIVEVGADRTVAPAPGDEVIDARGRFLMPGLWDSHTHLFSRARSILHLAGGVTTVRDMGNERDLVGLVRRAESGRDLGPHTLMAVRLGWDPEPGSVPVPQVRSADQAQQLVETYAARGYAQVKVLDDLDPQWVPVLADLAHARGMRLSGHVPSRMTVLQFLAGGADEIQHVASLLKDVPRDRRGELGDEVRSLLAEMARRGTTLDATLAQFEPTDAGGLGPVARALLPRLPPMERRLLERGAAPAEQQAARRRLFPVLLQIVKAAHDAGVAVLPGTDSSLTGFLLHRELALYVEAGIPAARVLRMATYDAARTMKRDGQSGSIAPGKVADMILIDGDPARDIADLARLEVVIKSGRPYQPAELYRLVSLRDVAQTR